MMDRLPAKPAGSQWTDEQWQAIVSGGKNILVAAAAGSGKTAVLVERIIRKIEADTDVDRLLVATFTHAAASEMKERIRVALEKSLEANPHSEHLRRQLALMNRAAITTLHSFCLDVIRGYYPLIQLDPGFRIANETESALIRLDVLDELFEERYSSGDIDFIQLADCYGNERGDEPLARLVQELFDFSQSHPFPNLWLENQVAAFQVTDIEGLSASPWVESLREETLLTLDETIELLKQAEEVAQQPQGPFAYATNIEAELEMLMVIRENLLVSSWSKWRDFMQQISFGRLKSVKADSCDPELQEQTKQLREQAKKKLGDLVNELYGREPEQFVQELIELRPLMQTLAQTVIAFGQRYEQAKREKGLLDFGDLEHYCLRILRDNEADIGVLSPSAAALEYQDRFDEILLDEYQDTNLVQEAIVSLITKPGAGNRFMVGDVKQSIYRFRLAEPGLFLQKYKEYRSSSTSTADLTTSGLRIDLARNFRSRKEVVDGVNTVFRSLMRESVAEMDYDADAELVLGASYPENRMATTNVEFVLLDRADAAEEEGDQDTFSGDEQVGDDVQDFAEILDDLKHAQLEARWIASKLHELKVSDYQVYDSKLKASRSIQWRDVVILVRSPKAWAPVFLEELAAGNVPAYADLGSGYFDAVEVETMLSLLRIIDNPYQDIPLAGVLRSPMFALSGEELAHIRLAEKQGSFYEAVQRAAYATEGNTELEQKLNRFLDALGAWREQARQGPLSDLLWGIYRQTSYFDFVGGLPGGIQRQANLRALLDRARQYEATSFRGLFQFLRFIERMRDTGGDLSAAKSLGEQEDVVRIMSIHSSKGLEFPLVFVASLSKQFNMQDLRASFLKHKQMGFGPRYVDSKLRTSYPSLPYLAIRRKLRMETLAEELRILYVALTRPKEKLFLIGTVNEAAKKWEQWSMQWDGGGELPDYRIVGARSFLDWLGPIAYKQYEQSTLLPPNKRWIVSITPASLLLQREVAATDESHSTSNNEARVFAEQRMQAVLALAELDGIEPENAIRDRLEWTYPYQAAALAAAKSSVTEMKRVHEAAYTEDAGWRPSMDQVGQTGTGSTFQLRRPQFLEQRSLTPVEKGSANHLLMQHIPLGELGDGEAAVIVTQTIERMLVQNILTREQADALDVRGASAFFAGELGGRMGRARVVYRELPFSILLPASEVQQSPAPDLIVESVLVQGIIDCLFEEEEGLVLVDYKTDRLAGKSASEAAEVHRFQLMLYGRAIARITGKPVTECYVYFFDGSQSVRVF